MTSQQARLIAFVACGIVALILAFTVLDGATATAQALQAAFTTPN